MLRDKYLCQVISTFLSTVKLRELQSTSVASCRLMLALIMAIGAVTVPGMKNTVVHKTIQVVLVFQSIGPKR